MKIGVIHNFSINLEADARSYTVLLCEEECDIYIFTGEIYKFSTAISLSHISLFQEILEVLSAVGRVIIFTKVCTWIPTSSKVYVPGMQFEEFIYKEFKLYFQDTLLQEGINENGTCCDLRTQGHFSITVEDDNIDNLPEIKGAIRFLELRYRNCSPLFLSYIQNLYGRIDSRIDLEDTCGFIQEPGWSIESIKWSNMYCYKSGSITFAGLPQISLICGKNGSGKSSLINIMLTAIFGKQSARPVKKGAPSGSILLDAIFENKKYTFDTKIVNSAGSTAVPFLSGLLPYNICCGKETIKGAAADADLPAANRFLQEICDFTLSISGNSIISHGNETVKYSECSSGQRFLIELALKITSLKPKPQVFFIDECIERLDQNHIEKCLAALRKTHYKFIIVGHRSELKNLPAYEVQIGRNGSHIDIL